MADSSTRTVTTVRREYVLPSPTNWGEVGKLLAVVRTDLGNELAHWDDTVKVEARDDEIVFSFEVSREVTP